jgi:hypothetical protein
MQGAMDEADGRGHALFSVFWEIVVEANVGGFRLVLDKPMPRPPGLHDWRIEDET